MLLTRAMRARAPLLARACSGTTPTAAPALAKAKPLAKAAPTTPLGWLGVYMELSKSRLSGLVVVTTACGHVMAPGTIDVPTIAAACSGTFLLSASANSFNQIIEIPYDSIMARTRQRPLPSERISPAHATAWASATGIGGLATLAICTNPLTTALGGSTLALYTLVYTPMKRTSPLNTWVGSVVGALPPVMGWTAAGGRYALAAGMPLHAGEAAQEGWDSQGCGGWRPPVSFPLTDLAMPRPAPPRARSMFAPESAVLFGSLFLWQMPHFFALAWLYRKDYELGGYRMVPLTDPTGDRTSWLCLEYSVYLSLLPPACWAAGITSCMFPLESIAFNGALLAAAWRFRAHEQRGQAHARRLFLASLAYLPIFFACLLLHQKRAPAELEAGVIAEDDANRDAINRMRSRGRELCLHEKHIALEEADAGRCPIVVADTVRAGASASPQPQR